LQYLECQNIYQDFWEIDRYSNDIKPGDIALIWKAKDTRKLDNRGIYAVVRILTKPKRQDIYELENDQAEIDKFKKIQKIAEHYWLDKEKMKKLSKKPLIWVEYTKFILDKPLSLSDAKVESILSGSTIKGNVPRHIVHEVSESQGKAIEQMIDSM